MQETDIVNHCFIVNYRAWGLILWITKRDTDIGNQTEIVYEM